MDDSWKNGKKSKSKITIRPTEGIKEINAMKPKSWINNSAGNLVILATKDRGVWKDMISNAVEQGTW